jgi:flavin reductase (DIM6/NTAB) family NADH-FMN oxidoreductase RutF
MNNNFFDESTSFLKRLQKSKAFLVTKSNDRINLMQIGWGYMGYMWKKQSIIIAVRHSRYSYELLRNSDEFTVCIPREGEFEEQLKICGTKSGRDIDKVEECRLEMAEGEKICVPHIKGCDSYECKVMYSQSIDSELLVKDIHEMSYRNNDYHVMIYGEIVAFRKYDED